MKLSTEQVAHLAKLSRLELDEETIEKYTTEIGSILGYVERIQAIDTENVEPFTMPIKEDWREDVVIEDDELAQDIVLSNFPKKTGELLAAPGVFTNHKYTNNKEIV